MEKLVYDDSSEQIQTILSEYKNGELSVICPKCEEEIIVILTIEDIKKHQKAPGIYCPNNHFFVVLNKPLRMNFDHT